MSDQRQDEFGSINATHRMWLFFNRHVQLLEQLQPTLEAASGERWGVLVPLSYSIKDSCETISLLAPQGKMRDCFVVARTVFETIVNFCFMCSEGNEAAARAEAHARQKAYRDLQREVDIDQRTLTVQWSGQVDLSSNPDLKAAVDEFTSRKGRERDWTPENVKQRIEAIDAKYGPKVATYLQVAFLAIYRHASEIADGTLFGSLFALGATRPSGPPTSTEDMAKHQRSNLTMILMVLGFSISSLLRVVASELPLQTLIDESDTAATELKKEGWAK